MQSVCPELFASLSSSSLTGASSSKSPVEAVARTCIFHTFAATVPRQGIYVKNGKKYIVK